VSTPPDAKAAQFGGLGVVGIRELTCAAFGGGGGSWADEVEDTYGKLGPR
jgi:hypothetical protein